MSIFAHDLPSRKYSITQVVDFETDTIQEKLVNRFKDSLWIYQKGIR